MQTSKDTKQIPVLWINLDSAKRRNARMSWALNEGGWRSHRFSAIDGADKNQKLFSIPNPVKAGTKIPGVYRSDEAEPKRKTSIAEMACLASWKHILLRAQQVETQSNWVLLMEDDLGASLAEPDGWAHSLIDIIDSCPSRTLAIQLAPISAKIRKELAIHWKESKGKCLTIAKERVRSHGNGAVLLHRKAIDQLIDPLIRVCNRFKKNWHPLIHPWRLRPVADKWIYGSLPPFSCQVATYPHFCLEAIDSSLHIEHVNAIHLPSRNITLEIWEQDNRQKLIEAQRKWDEIKTDK